MSNRGFPMGVAAAYISLKTVNRTVFRPLGGSTPFGGYLYNVVM